MVLIISCEEDIHPNGVIEKLEVLSIPYFRLNTEYLLRDYDIHVSIDNDESNFVIVHKFAGHKVSNKDITAVWERRPMEPICLFDEGFSPQIEELMLKEAHDFLKYFRYSLNDVFWFGNPIKERKGSSKIWQMQIAKKVGFDIPTTVYSNDLSKTLDLFEGKDLAIKPVTADGIMGNDKEVVFYTKKIPFQEFKYTNEIGFRNNINHIESYTEKKYELRITYVKDEAFSCKIDSQVKENNEGRIDWREGYDHEISFTPIVLPNEIEKKCRAFLEEVECSFGCFDIIVTENDQYVFLECNLNGQWLWIEEVTGLEISKKLADIFSKEFKKKNLGVKC
jgi:glutathione synthase/RimK-type ligase-like ATP-grasp enzyme